MVQIFFCEHQLIWYKYLVKFSGFIHPRWLAGWISEAILVSGRLLPSHPSFTTGTDRKALDSTASVGSWIFSRPFKKVIFVKKKPGQVIQAVTFFITWYWDGPMEVIVTSYCSKLVYFTYLRDENNLLI